MRYTVETRAPGAAPSRFASGARTAIAAAFVFALSAGAAGCATTSSARPTPAATAAAEADRTIADLRAKNAGYARRVGELENKVFILEDQLTARRAAEIAHAGPKPSVHIVPRREDSAEAMSGILAHGKPAPEPARPPTSSPGEGEARTENGGSSVLSDEDVEYGGDALTTGHRASRTSSHRPVLRLHGEGRSTAVAAELASSAGGKASKARSIYRRALTLLRAGKDKKALAAFRRFVTRHPHHELADDAQYWIAECQYDKNDLPGAEAEYRQLIEKYPQGDRVPDAMLKLGVTLVAEGEADSGKRVLESLARGYPDNDAGRAAAARLARRDAPAGRGQPTVLGTVVPPAVATTAEPRHP